MIKDTTKDMMKDTTKDTNMFSIWYFLTKQFHEIVNVLPPFILLFFVLNSQFSQF